MITLKIQIKAHKKYQGVYQLIPSFDGRTATEFEADLFADLLARLAPGINFEQDLDAQMDYLEKSLVGVDPEDPETSVVA